MTNNQLPRAITSQLGHTFISTIRLIQNCTATFQTAILRSRDHNSVIDDPDANDDTVTSTPVHVTNPSTTTISKPNEVNLPNIIDREANKQKEAIGSIISDNRTIAFEIIDQLPEGHRPVASELCACVQEVLNEVEEIFERETEGLLRGDTGKWEWESVEEMGTELRDKCELAFRVVEQRFGVREADTAGDDVVATVGLV